MCTSFLKLNSQNTYFGNRAYLGLPLHGGALTLPKLRIIEIISCGAYNKPKISSNPSFLVEYGV